MEKCYVHTVKIACYLGAGVLTFSCQGYWTSGMSGSSQANTVQIPSAPPTPAVIDVTADNPSQASGDSSQGQDQNSSGNQQSDGSQNTGGAQAGAGNQGADSGINSTGNTSGETLHQFTSGILNSIMQTKSPANALPYWYGYNGRHEIYSSLDTWTESLYNQIAEHAPNMYEKVANDVQHFCPKFAELDREKRILFWVRLVSILSSQESSFNTNATHQEPPSVGQDVLSSGLLQLSVESALQSQFGCDQILQGRSQAQANLFDPQRNMACAVRIMNYYLGRDEVITGYVSDGSHAHWQGLARYWAPFRHPRLRQDKDAFYTEIDGRRSEWQQASRARDVAVLAKAQEDLQAGREWSVASWEFQHPSLQERELQANESHLFTSLLRLSNQTSFCF